MQRCAAVHARIAPPIGDSTRTVTSACVQRGGSCAYGNANAKEPGMMRTREKALRLSVAVVSSWLFSGDVSSVRAQTPATPAPAQTTTPPANTSQTRMDIYGDRKSVV